MFHMIGSAFRAVGTGSAVVLLAAAVTAQAPEPPGARSMFYNPATGTLSPPPPLAQPLQEARPGPARQMPKSGTVQFVGIHYWLDLEGVGPVADTRVFYTGQRIRLNVRSNCDGFFAVWTLQTDGTAALLVPESRAARGVALQPGQPFVTAPIRFNAPVADERLMVFFARQKAGLPSFETLRADAALSAFRGAGARDLSIEIEESAPGEIGTYVVNRRGGAVAKDITLRHASPPGK